MDLHNAFRISASGLRASRTWLNVISANLANANTTKTASGQPYERRTVIYESVPSQESFDEMACLAKALLAMTKTIRRNYNGKTTRIHH